MDIITHTDIRTLRAPILIVGVSSPGNSTAGTAVEAILAAGEADLIAECEPDELYDFTVARPLARVQDGERVIEWPRLTVHRLALAARDVLFLTGLEPHLRWRRVAKAIAEFARVSGVRETVLLSAFDAATPHTRPSRLTWFPLTGRERSLEHRFGRPASSPQYQGPATFTMALGRVLADEGLPVVSVNALAPFYVRVDPSPHAALRLASAVAEEFGLPVETRLLEAAVQETGVLIGRQLSESPALAEFVANLEQQQDEVAATEVLASEAASRVRPQVEESLPEASSILAHVEAFLKEHGSDRGGRNRPAHSV